MHTLQDLHTDPGHDPVGLSQISRARGLDHLAEGLAFGVADLAFEFGGYMYEHDPAASTA